MKWKGGDEWVTPARWEGRIKEGKVRMFLLSRNAPRGGVSAGRPVLVLRDVAHVCKLGCGVEVCGGFVCCNSYLKCHLLKNPHICLPRNYSELGTIYGIFTFNHEITLTLTTQ